MSDVKHHRPSKEFLQILRSVGAEGEVFTRQQVVFYLREYVIVNRLFDVTKPHIVSLKGDSLASILGRPTFAIDEIENLIDDIPSEYVVPNRREGIDDPSSSSSSLIQFKSLPSSISSFHPVSTSLDLSRRKDFSLDAEEILADYPLQRPSLSLPLLSFSTSTAPPSITDSKDSFAPSWPPWFSAFQRLPTTSVASDEKSEVLSLQGYETAPVEDSSDDLWYLDTSPNNATEARVVTPDEDNFQVEFEVESDTEVDGEFGGLSEEEEDDDQEDEEEVLLGEENDDFAFLSRVAGTSARADSDVEFWADHSSDDDDDDSEEEGVVFEFEEEDRHQRRLVEGEASDSSDSDADLESDQEKWVCEECSTRNRPFVRFCERCWKLRPGWLMDKLKMRRMRNTKSAKDDSGSRLSEEGEEEQEEEEQQERDLEENPRVDVGPNQPNQPVLSYGDTGEGAVNVRPTESVAPAGLLDFDWDGTHRDTLSVETDGRDTSSKNFDTSTSQIVDSEMPVDFKSIDASVYYSRAPSFSTTSNASLDVTTSTTASNADESEFRCESQASLFSQSSIVSLASTRDHDVDENRGSGATSALSTVESQDSGFDGSQDNFSRHSDYSPFPRRDDRSELKLRDTWRRGADLDDIHIQLKKKDDGKFDASPGESTKSECNVSDNFSPASFTLASSFSRGTSTSSKSSTLPANMSLFSKRISSCVSGQEASNEHQLRRYSFDRSTMGRCPIFTEQKSPHKSAPKTGEGPILSSLASLRSERCSKIQQPSDRENLNGSCYSERPNHPPASVHASSLLALRVDDPKLIENPPSFNVAHPNTNDSNTTSDVDVDPKFLPSLALTSALSNETQPEPTESLNSGEAMAIMDSLPQFDRLRNISGGSSTTGSSTEELSAASGDDADVFKRPTDRPPFSRKRKDRQSSGSSTASAFRPAHSLKNGQPNEHKKGKGHHPAKLPQRSSTVIFSIRGSSPDRSSELPTITSSASFALGRSHRTRATLLDSNGTTISVNSGAITSFTVKKRSKAKRLLDHTSQPAPLPPKATTETSTQCDRGDVAMAESRGTDNDADESQDKCIICLTRPKNASIIHGYLGHQVCCCKCARKLRRLGKPCPICRRPIQHIVKNVIV